MESSNNPDSNEVEENTDDPERGISPEERESFQEASPRKVAYFILGSKDSFLNELLRDDVFLREIWPGISNTIIEDEVLQREFGVYEPSIHTRSDHGLPACAHHDHDAPMTDNTYHHVTHFAEMPDKKDDTAVGSGSPEAAKVSRINIQKSVGECRVNIDQNCPSSLQRFYLEANRWSTNFQSQKGSDHMFVDLDDRLEGSDDRSTDPSAVTGPLSAQINGIDPQTEYAAGNLEHITDRIARLGSKYTETEKLVTQLVEISAQLDSKTTQQQLTDRPNAIENQDGEDTTRSKDITTLDRLRSWANNRFNTVKEGITASKANQANESEKIPTTAMALQQLHDRLDATETEKETIAYWQYSLKTDVESLELQYENIAERIADFDPEEKFTIGLTDKDE